MSSCCGNEFFFSSVTKEIVDSNLEFISYFASVTRDYWSVFGAICIGLVVIVIVRKNGVKI